MFGHTERMDDNMVIVENNPQKFVSSLIETLHDKISQIQEEIKDCPTDELQQCEQWVMVLNEPLIEIEDEAGFIHVSNSYLKEKTEDMFCLLDSLQKSIAIYKTKQKDKMKEETINNEINKNEKLQFRMEQLDSQIKYFESEEKRLKEKIFTLEVQKEGLLTRLSEVAGMKVFENNPNVQDLSDTKRPMKLVEAFGELYDNEWTDALEDLLKKQIPERQAIENLKDILKTIFDLSCTSARDQRIGIAKCLLFDDACTECDSDAVPQTLRRRLKMLQKEASMDVFPYIKKQIDRRIDRESLSEDLQKYADRCAMLSWLMNVQDPPLILKFAAHPGGVVNKTIFTVYTKNGDVIDFVVWPVVMYEMGTVLRKGVIQPQ